MYVKKCRKCQNEYVGDGRRAYCDDCREERTAASDDARLCVICSSDISHRHHLARFCSDCRGTTPGQEKSCKDCGTSLMDRRRSRCDECSGLEPEPKQDSVFACTLCAEEIVGRGCNAKYCKSCLAKGERRRANGYMPNDNQKARLVTKYAVKIGFLPKPTDFHCVDCGSQAECYDHRDYKKPLDVDPVCLRCNSRRGRGCPLHGSVNIFPGRFIQSRPLNTSKPLHQKPSNKH